MGTYFSMAMKSFDNAQVFYRHHIHSFTKSFFFVENDFWTNFVMHFRNTFIIISRGNKNLSMSIDINVT